MSILTYVIEGCFSLLYPLKWETVYIPVLPPSLINCIEAPTAYVIGASTDHVLEHIEALDDSVCVVDIDGDMVKYPASVGTVHHRRIVKYLRHTLASYRNGSKGAIGRTSMSSQGGTTFADRDLDREVPLKRYFTDRNCFYFKPDCERAIRSVFATFLCPIISSFRSFSTRNEEALDKIIRDRPDLDVEFIEQVGHSRMLCCFLDSWTAEDLEMYNSHVAKEKDFVSKLFAGSSLGASVEDLHFLTSSSDSGSESVGENLEVQQEQVAQSPFCLELKPFDNDRNDEDETVYRKDSGGFTMKTGLLKFQFWQPFERVVHQITKILAQKDSRDSNIVKLLWIRGVCLFHMGFFLESMKDFVSVFLDSNEDCVHRLVTVERLKEVLKLMHENDRKTLPTPLLMFVAGEENFENFVSKIKPSWGYSPAHKLPEDSSVPGARRSVFSRRKSHAPNLLSEKAMQFQGDLARRQSILEESEGNTLFPKQLNDGNLADESRRNRIVLNVLDKNPDKRKSVVNGLDLSLSSYPSGSSYDSLVPSKFAAHLLETVIAIFRDVCPNLPSDRIGFIFRDAVRLNSASRSEPFKQFVVECSKLEELDVSPGKFDCDEERFCFYVNIRNTLLVHALLEFGPPRSKLQNLILHGITCYNIGGKLFPL